MLLKQKIEQYKNKEINIDDVIVDDHGNSLYSINDNIPELKELLTIANFNERNYLFKAIFCYHFEENKKSETKKLKEVVDLFFQKDSLGTHVNELLNIKKETILNILPLLPEDTLKENMKWLWKSINILDIDSDNIRKIYFNEYEMNVSSDNSSLADQTDSVLWYVSNCDDKFDCQMLHNIAEAVKLINISSEGFIEKTKNIYPDNYSEELMNLFLLDIHMEESGAEESIREYANFMIKNIKRGNVHLASLIIPEDIDHLLNSINPIMFDCILDELITNECKTLDKLIEMYGESGNFHSEDNSNYEKNKNCLFVKKSVLEKRELLNNLSESDNSHEVKRRL